MSNRLPQGGFKRQALFRTISAWNHQSNFDQKDTQNHQLKF